MNKTVDKKVYTVQDMWQAYVKKLLAEDTNRYSRYEKSMSNHSVYIDINGRKIIVMNYPRFRRIIEHYFDKAKKEIIKGNAVDMKSGLGRIAAKRVERDFRRPTQRRVDWAKTRQQPLVENPKDPTKLTYKNRILNIQPDWCRIGWFKGRKIDNIGVYKFSPTNPSSSKVTGFKKEFVEALNKDPLLKYQYVYQEIKEIKKAKNGV